MKRINTSDLVYNKIIEDFINNEIDFGDKITEIDLSNKFQVSRTPLREAVKRLEQEGLITRLSNGRIRIIELSVENINELFQVRVALENMLLENTMDDADLLENLHKSIQTSAKLCNEGNLDEARKEVSNFTTILYGSLTMETTINLLRSYSIIISKFKFSSLSTMERIEDAIKDHLDIYNALIEKDYDLACKINRLHIFKARDKIKDFYF